jgi:hypothetical protein
MTTDYEDSSSTPEKLVLLIYIAAIVIGNVSFDLNRKIIFRFKFYLDLRIYHVSRTC